MKYLLIIALIFITGCFGPKFKVGDCIELDDRESWQNSDEYQFYKNQIVEIGKSHYRFKLPNHYFTDTISSIDLMFHKIECEND